MIEVPAQESIEKQEIPLKEKASTSCLNCVFANWDEDGNQLNCQLNRLEKFHNKGTTVYLRKTPEGKIYYEIDRICMAARQQPWAEENKAHKLELLVRKEITLQAQAIIYVDKESNKNILKTIKSLSESTLLPKAVQVVLNYNNSKRGPIIQAFNDDYPMFDKWFIQTQTVELRGKRSKALDFAVHGCAFPFYFVINAGFKVPKNFLKNIDVAINDKLDRFIMIKGDNKGNLNFVMTAVHKAMGGNEIAELIEVDTPTGEVMEGIINKLSTICKKYKSPELMRNYNEFV